MLPLTWKSNDQHQDAIGFQILLEEGLWEPAVGTCDACGACSFEKQSDIPYWPVSAIQICKGLWYGTAFQLELQSYARSDSP